MSSKNKQKQRLCELESMLSAQGDAIDTIKIQIRQIQAILVTGTKCTAVPVAEEYWLQKTDAAVGFQIGTETDQTED